MAMDGAAKTDAAETGTAETGTAEAGAAGSSDGGPAGRAAVTAFTLRCELGKSDVRDVMAASRMRIVLRRSWIVACAVLAAFLAELAVLLRLVFSPHPADMVVRSWVRPELAAGAGLCALLVCWSLVRVWRLSPGRQAADALSRGVWQRGTYWYEVAANGVTWRAPDGSIVFLPWPAVAGVRESKCLYLLVGTAGRRHVRGFIPKRAAGDPGRVAQLGAFLRSRVRAAGS